MSVVVARSFSTTDPEVARAAVSDAYAPGERPLLFPGTPARVQFQLTTLQAGDLHAGRVRQALPLRITMPPFDDFMATTLLDGGVTWDCGDGERRIGRGGCSRYATTAPTRGSWSSFETALVRLPTDVVQRVADAACGTTAGPLRFHGLAPVTAAAGVQWRSLSAHVHRTLSLGAGVGLRPGRTAAPGPGEEPLSPLLLARLVDLAAATAMAVFPNNLTAAHRAPGPGRAGPATLRRAVAHIEAHAGEPVTLADITTAAGTTGRALQESFRRHHGTTPMGYLRRVRLEGVHWDLQAADPGAGVTVADVAAAWGFGRAGRSSRFYRQQHGVAPSTTLRG